MTDIDAREAAQALREINDIVRRVRQSRTYDIASLMIILWGVLVLSGNLANYAWPRQAAAIWIGVNLLGTAGSLAIAFGSIRRQGGERTGVRILAAFLMVFAFGILASSVLGHFGPREMATFWPIYSMLFYCIAGLWFGYAFLALGLGISALVLIGYFFITGDAFLLWMAAVNGGGLILSGLWMRWGE
jgi:hypothetical protein